jgi:hopanoid-associated phosphorylase
MSSEAQFADATFTENLLGLAEEADRASNAALEARRLVIAFVGMAFEARIAAGPGILVFARNARRELAATAANAARQGYRGIISFGVAGGLAGHLRTGDWVVASSVIEADGPVPTDAGWSRRLLDAIGDAHHGPILGVDTPVAEPATKRQLHRTSGAAAVDMESHIVARLAAQHGLAFTALRVIVDPVERAIPPAALLGMGPDARADTAAIMRDLIARPRQLPLLARLTWDAFIARSQMQRVRGLLGSHFGLLELPSAAAAADDELAPVLQPIAPA